MKKLKIALALLAAFIVIGLLGNLLPDSGSKVTPPQIANLTLGIATPAGVLPYQFTLTQFVSGLASSGATIQWNTAGSDAWQLRIKRVDPVTKAKHLSVFVFSKVNALAVVSRLVFDGEDIAAAQLGPVVAQIINTVVMSGAEKQ